MSGITGRVAWFACALELAACGANQLSADAGADADDGGPGISAPSASSVQNVNDVPDARAVDPTDAGVDVDDSGAADAHAADAVAEAGPIDAGSDALFEDASSGSTDSGADAESDDAGSDAATSSDASSAQDSSTPPPGCSEGAFRCSEYQTQMCTDGAWAWQVGDQSCCHDSRFTVVGDTVHDSQTGVVWFRYAGQSTNSQVAAACASLIANGRLPTAAELLAITIGQPVSNKAVCEPTVDQKAFLNVASGDSYVSDGCVDLIWATSKASCSPDGASFLCVSGP